MRLLTPSFIIRVVSPLEPARLPVEFVDLLLNPPYPLLGLGSSFSTQGGITFVLRYPKRGTRDAKTPPQHKNLVLYVPLDLLQVPLKALLLIGPNFGLVDECHFLDRII
jgi:hypothetical protein